MEDRALITVADGWGKSYKRRVPSWRVNTCSACSHGGKTTGYGHNWHIFDVVAPTRASHLHF